MHLPRLAALAVTGAAGVLSLSLALPATAASAATAGAPEQAPVTQREGASYYDLVSGALGVADKILDIVVSAIETNQNREGVVKSMVEGAWFSNDEVKNILVMKADHPYTADLQGITFDAVYHPAGYPAFRVVAFDSGTVTNNGDGGYINWAFQGWFDRTDNTVNFHQP